MCGAVICNDERQEEKLLEYHKCDTDCNVYANNFNNNDGVHKFTASTEIYFHSSPISYTQFNISNDSKQTSQITSRKETPSLSHSSSFTSFSSLRHARKFCEVENFKVISLVQNTANTVRLSSWITTEMATPCKVIHEGQLFKYSCIANKSVIVPRYCMVSKASLKYYHSYTQSMEWLSKPIIDIKMSDIEQVNRIVLEDKKMPKYKHGFEILIKWPKNKGWSNFDVFHSMFACLDEIECIKWILIIKHLSSSSSV